MISPSLITQFPKPFDRLNNSNLAYLRFAMDPNITRIRIATSNNQTSTIAIASTSLASQTPKSKKRKARDAPFDLRLRDMRIQESFSIPEFYQTAKIDITLAQLLHYSPKIKAALAKAIRLEPNSNKKSSKRVQVTIGNQPRARTSEINVVFIINDTKNDWHYDQNLYDSTTRQSKIYMAIFFDTKSAKNWTKFKSKVRFT